jgi:hypothetical protein
VTIQLQLVVVVVVVVVVIIIIIIIIINGAPVKIAVLEAILYLRA